MLTPHIKMVSLSNPSKRHTRYAVVNEENGIGKAVVRRIFGEDGFLVHHAAAVVLQRIFLRTSGV